MLLALTREVSAGVGQCELTHLKRVPIDLDRARAEHRVYRQKLRELGCRVRCLPEEPELADSVFVEDIAVVFAELAVLARPGAPSRRGERLSIAQALEPYRPLHRIRAPGILDGGDVLTLGREVYVGRSSRSNSEAVEQLARAVTPHGYSVTEVDFRGCLHLKSAVSRVAEDTVLVNPEWVDADVFRGMHALGIDPREPAAANALAVGPTVLAAAEHPRTLDLLRARGIDARPIEAGELAKAEGGLTCCSLLFDEDEPLKAFG